MTTSCAFCVGTGLAPHSIKMICLACHGKGKVEFEHAAIACPACKGNGRASGFSMLSCTQCRGVGMVEEVHEEKTHDGKQHEKKRKRDIIKDIFRKIGKRLSEAVKWIKNRLIEKILQFKTIIHKIKRHS